MISRSSVEFLRIQANVIALDFDDSSVVLMKFRFPVDDIVIPDTNTTTVEPPTTKSPETTTPVPTTPSTTSSTEIPTTPSTSEYIKSFLG